MYCTPFRRAGECSKIRIVRPKNYLRYFNKKISGERGSTAGEGFRERQCSTPLHAPHIILSVSVSDSRCPRRLHSQHQAGANRSLHTPLCGPSGSLPDTSDPKMWVRSALTQSGRYMFSSFRRLEQSSTTRDICRVTRAIQTASYPFIFHLSHTCHAELYRNVNKITSGLII